MPVPLHSAPVHTVVSATCLLLSIGLVGCSVGPEYRPPEMELPDGWTKDASAGTNTSSSKNPFPSDGWWEDFTDDDLDRLLVRLHEVSPDLHRARWRIEEAWVQRHVIRAGGYPKADFTSRKEWGLGDFEDNSIDFKQTDSWREFAQTDMAWEIDLFGHRRRRVEASTAQWESTIEAWRGSLLFLIGEVSLRYIDIRVNEERIGLLRDDIEILTKIADITVEKEEEGLVSQTEVLEAEARLRAKEAEIPRFQATVAENRNALARLLAIYPGELSKILPAEGSVPEIPPTIGTGVPAQTLRSRPDVRLAERKLAKAVAEVGVATSRFYPELNLSGAITYEILSRGGVHEINRRTIGGGATLVKRLFHAGADRARVAEQEAFLQQQLRTYEAIIHQGVMETENALAGLYFGRERLRRASLAAEAADKAYQALAEAFEDGLIDVRDLLRAEQDRHDLSTEALFARNNLAKSAVLLYKATGGGGIPLPPEELKTNLEASETPAKPWNRFFSRLLSLGGDNKHSLHRKQKRAAAPGPPAPPPAPDVPQDPPPPGNVED